MNKNVPLGILKFFLNLTILLLFHILVNQSLALSNLLQFLIGLGTVVNFILLWISVRHDNKPNFFVEYIIRLNQPDIYNNYINPVCFETLNLNS